MNAPLRSPLWACAVAGALCAAALVGAACDDSSAVHETPPTQDAATTTPSTDAGTTTTSDGATTTDGSISQDDCVANPTTHLELINACTDAMAFDKTPNLPLLLPDGGLPPLP
jgi:hypothetical protein